MDAMMIKQTPWGGYTNNTTSTDARHAPSRRSAQEEADNMAALLGVSNPAHFTDEQLMQQIAHGDSVSLEALYDRHVRGAFGLAMKIVRDPAVAEEVVQDVFVKLWSNPAVFTPDRGKFSGWLLTLVHNRSVDKLRRAKAGVQGNTVPLDAEGDGGMSLADVLPDTGPDPEEIAWTGEKGAIVRQALSQLPDAQRTAISLAYFGGLTQKEIADRLQEPLGTIKTRTRSGLQQLRRLLVRQGVWGDLR